MMFGRVVFGPIVGVVGFLRPPVDAKLLLALAIAEPMKMHVHGFSLFQLDFTNDDGIGPVIFLHLNADGELIDGRI